MQRAGSLRARLHSVPLPSSHLPIVVRFTHGNSPSVPPPADRRSDRSLLTGAAKLLAEAEDEDGESRVTGFQPRPDSVADDSPPWTGDESVRDAVIRLLMDKHKPLRTGRIVSSDSRMHELSKKTDMSPRVKVEATPPTVTVADTILREREIPAEDFKPWHARYVRSTSAAIPRVYYGKSMPTQDSRSSISLLDRQALPIDPAARRVEKNRRRVEERVQRVEGAKEGALDYRLGGGQGYQTKGASAAGGGVRGGPSGVRAWQNLVEDRIERARNAGWFDDVKGRGQPIYADPDQHNPHIDRSEFFMNRIVKRQGAKPPWIELLGELEAAQAAFRNSLLSSYSRSLLRTLLTSPFHDRESLAALTSEDIASLRDPAWKKREEGYHEEAVKQLNDLVRKMNALAPQVVRRGLVTLDNELALAYAEAGPVVVGELAKRRSEDWGRVKGMGDWEDDAMGRGNDVIGQGLWKDAWGLGEVIRRFTRGLLRLLDAGNRKA